MRSAWITVRWVIAAAAVVSGQRAFGQSSGRSELLEVLDRISAPDRVKGPRWPVFDQSRADRPEFSIAAIERGEADEPDIGRMDADAADGVKVTATVERTELQPLEPVRLSAAVKN